MKKKKLINDTHIIAVILSVLLLFLGIVLQAVEYRPNTPYTIAENGTSFAAYCMSAVFLSIAIISVFVEWLRRQ